MIEVEIEDEAWTRALPDCEAVVTRAAQAALLACRPGRREAESRDPERPAPALGPGSAVPAARDDNWDLTILLADDDAVQALNAQFRRKDKPTNVLSFPAPETARPHLGDVALAYGVCAEEAAAQGKTLSQHLMHLTAHGVLHLLGYDHETEAEAEDMEGLERAILAGLGLPDPYETNAQP